MRVFVVATAMLFASVAHAEPCAEVYTIDSLLADMVAVEEAYGPETTATPPHSQRSLSLDWPARMRSFRE